MFQFLLHLCCFFNLYRYDSCIVSDDCRFELGKLVVKSFFVFFLN